MKSIVIIIDYFGGTWPSWIDLYFLSCSRNPTITWLVHTDCPVDGMSYNNVIFVPMSWEDYKQTVSQRLAIKFDPTHPYKICDLRPAFGFIWKDEIKCYDFYGYGDVDVIYGDLRAFLTDDLLRNHVISTHGWCFSGHFCLFRNQEWLRQSFRKIRYWREMFTFEHHYRVDEDHFFRVFVRPNRFTPKFSRLLISIIDVLNPFRRKYRMIHMKEMYTTPLVPGLWIGSPVEHSDVWYWRDGKITNAVSGERDFIYLHFMNYVNARYMDRLYGEMAPWDKLDCVVNVSAEHAEKGFRIDLEGFNEIGQ